MFFKAVLVFELFTLTLFFSSISSIFKHKQNYIEQQILEYMIVCEYLYSKKKHTLK